MSPCPTSTPLAEPESRAAAQPPALILAAGRGERLRPFTDTCPKPLLAVRGRPLIEWHLRALAGAGVRRVVVNVAWLGERLVQALGDGSALGLRLDLRWSREDLRYGRALETAGGLAEALPLLEAGPDDPVWLVSGDIHAPAFPFDAEVARHFTEHERHLDARLWTVPNPPYHPRGDFPAGAAGGTVTYANLALVRPRLLRGLAAGTPAPLGPLLQAGLREGRVALAPWEGEWHNVGTPADLAALQTTGADGPG